MIALTMTTSEMKQGLSISPLSLLDVDKGILGVSLLWIPCMNHES